MLTILLVFVFVVFVSVLALYVKLQAKYNTLSNSYLELEDLFHEQIHLVIANGKQDLLISEVRNCLKYPLDENET